VVTFVANLLAHLLSVRVEMRETREKRKHSDFVHPIDRYAYGESPNRVRLIHRESVVLVSTTLSQSKFGEAGMSLAQQGLLHRNSLEDSCLSADGE
jgi:serine/arginine repetitive matrix protein 2